MKNYIVLMLFFFSSFCFGQIGVKSAYVKPDFSRIEDRILLNERVDIFSSGFAMGIFYAYRINGKGIVLLPEIDYIRFNSVISDKEYVLTQFSFGIPLKIYPFNLKGDCGCPDFSLRNKYFEKHFFLIFNNGIIKNIKKRLSDTEIIESYFSYLVGAGVGITIPLSEKIRLEPFFNFNRVYRDYWSKEFLDQNEVDTKISYDMPELGIRVRLNL